jgi:hypothetical protein
VSQVSGVRNGALSRGQTQASGLTVLGEVPPNFVWLVKSISILNVAAAAAAVILGGAAPGNGTQLWIAAIDLEPGVGQLLELWVPLNAGDQLYLSADQAPLHFWIGGAALPGGFLDSMGLDGR